jgi:hypothetical protein
LSSRRALLPLAVVFAAALVAMALIASSALEPSRTITDTITTTSPVTVTGAPSDRTVTDTVTVSPTGTVSTSSSSTSSSQTTSASCTVSGQGGPTYLQVVTNQGAPVQNQQIRVVQDGPSVNGHYCGTSSLPTLTTNSTGWAEVIGTQSLPYAGSLAVSLVYQGRSFNATIAIYPATWTYVTVQVPSGVVFTNNCPENSCPSYTDSMTMGG